MSHWTILPGVWLQRLLRSRAVVLITRTDLRLSLFLLVVVVFFHFPSYDVALVLHETDSTWNGVLRQIGEPFTDHSGLYDPASHSAKLGFRFVPAVILHLLGLRSIAGGLIFQFVTLIVFYLLLVPVLRRWLHDRALVLAFALPICFVIAGHVYASDFRGIFDTLALDLLLLAMLWRRSILIIIPLLLAYFTDERALIGSGSFILLDLYLEERYTSAAVMLKGLRSRPVLAVLASWLLYLGIRLLLGYSIGLRSAPVDVIPYLRDNAHQALIVLYDGLEGFLIPFVLVSLWLARKKKAYAFLLGIWCSLGVSYITALSVIDVDRSMAYILPWLLLILLIWFRNSTRERLFDVLGWMLVLGLIYDRYYPLLAQIYRMRYVSHTI